MELLPSILDFTSEEYWGERYLKQVNGRIGVERASPHLFALDKGALDKGEDDVSV